MIDFLFFYGTIVSLIAFIGIPVIALRHIVKQTPYTKLNYTFTSIFLSGFLSFWIFVEYTRTGIIDISSMFFYFFLTWFTIFSLLGLICLIVVHSVKKTKFSKAERILLIVFIIGLYSYIPRFLTLTPSEQYMKIGTQMAVIPFDRQVGYLNLGKYAALESLKLNPKTGAYNAIKYYEKAICGKYTKFQQDSYELAKQYVSVKNYNKALEIINQAEKNKHSVLYFGDIKADVYILLDRYNDAIDTLLKNKYINSDETKLFLISALYNKTGDRKKADEYSNKAQKIYNERRQLTPYFYNIVTENYQSIEAYKKHLQNKYRQL